MPRTMMTSRIHRATVTQADLLEAADLLPEEPVHIVDVTNGARLETCTTAGERGSGVLGINGAAAHPVHPGDVVILIAYGQMDTAQARSYSPSVVLVDDHKCVVETGTDPAEALPGTELVRGSAPAWPSHCDLGTNLSSREGVR